MVSCPSSMVSAVCVVPFPPHAGGFLTLSISTTSAASGERWPVRLLLVIFGAEAIVLQGCDP